MKPNETDLVLDATHQKEQLTSNRANFEPEFCEHTRKPIKLLFYNVLIFYPLINSNASWIYLD